MPDQLLSTDPNAAVVTPAPRLLSADPNAATLSAATPPPAARQPVAARGTKGTPPYISDETSQLLGGMAGAALVGGATEGLGLIPEAAAGTGALVRGGLAVARRIPSVVGAYGGGAGVAAAQGAPAAKINDAGTDQALIEAGGHLATGAILWPFKRVAATSIYRAATGKIAEARQVITDQLGTAFTNAQRAVEDAITTKAAATEQAALRTEMATSTGKRAVSDAHAAGQRAVASATEEGRTAVQAARTTARTSVDTAQDTLRATKAAGTQRLEAAHTDFANTPPPASTTGEVGRQLGAVLTKAPPRPGMPKSAVGQTFDRLGERVGASLKAMPDQDVRAIRAQAQEILDRETVLPTGGGEASHAPAALSSGVNGAALPPPAAGSSYAARLAEAQVRAGIPPPPTEVVAIPSPSRTALQRIAAMPDKVTAEELHQANETLNTVVGAKWDNGLTNQGVGRAKKVYGTIRAQLGAASPEFDQAAADYAHASQAYKNSLAPRIVRLAKTNPDAVAALVKSTEPEKLKMLQQVLFEQGGTDGQQAWDALRSHVIHDQFIAGGLDGLSERLAAAPHEFISTLAHDDAGRQVIGNLHQIASGFDALKASVGADTQAAAAGVRTARRTGDAAVSAATDRAARVSGTVRTQTAAFTTATRDARDTAVAQAKGAQRATVQATTQRVQTAKGTQDAVEHGITQATAQVNAQEKALKATSLAKIPSGEQTAKDLATLGVVAGTSAVLGSVGGPVAGYGGFTALGLARRQAVERLMRTPEMADLVQWSSMAPLRTQRLVQALRSPAPGMMLADLFRWYGLATAEQRPVASHPPAATPPPGPPR